MSAGPSATRPLRSRVGRKVWSVTPQDLPVVSAHGVTNRLYGARGMRLDGLLWYWQFGWPSRIQEWITLTADDLRLQLALDGDATGFATPQLDWRNYEDETRLLAWTACHEPLIALLRIMFQCDWVPQSLGNCDIPPAAHCVRAGFAVHRADSVPLVSGVTIFDASCMRRLMQCAPFSEPRLHAPLRDVRAKLPILIDQIDIIPSELAGIGRGAIVRLDNRTLAGGAARVAIPAGYLRLIADVTGMRATVVGAGPPAPPVVEYHPHEGNPMSTDHSPPSETSADKPQASAERERGIAVGALPVRLTFSAGHLTLPFGTLADVGPGFVFELEKRLDDQTISIQANDVPIATGELVVIGDLVGVRITRMLPQS